jgi:outer membrane protein TolC
MPLQLNAKSIGPRVMKVGVSVMFAAVLSACVNYAGIHSDQQIAQPQSYETTQSIPSESGHWPAAGWADQFGDAQLKTLLDEALKNSPSLDQARARVAAANAYSETAKANTMPKVGADYSLSRQQYSGTALVPPP